MHLPRRNRGADEHDGSGDGDTGGGVKGRWIDLGYDEDELVAWSSYVDVYYLTPIPEEINYLIPEVLP